MEIRTVAVLGANGVMGSQCAGIIAGFGNANVYMVARDLDKAQLGIISAIDSIKSDIILPLLIPKTYTDLETILPECDWIFEVTAEDLQTKHSINQQISKFKKPGAIVSTASSGLSINELARDFSPEEQKYYFGTHLYNPPYKMLLCELISNKNSDPKTQSDLLKYLQTILHRKVVVTQDSPGFAGNRVGFQILNEAVIFSQKYQKEGGLAFIDYLLGGFTGRALSPISTIDLVGLDVHRAIVNNIYGKTNDDAHESFKMPDFMDYLISNNFLGNKSGQGFYKKENDQKLVFNIHTKNYDSIPQFDFEFVNKAKEKITDSDYVGGYNIILKTNTPESNIIKYFWARYISYSFSLIGTVVATKEDVDRVMAYGFNWLPPCALIDLIGGKDKTIELISQYHLSVPEIIKHYNSDNFYTLQPELDFRSFIKAN